MIKNPFQCRCHFRQNGLLRFAFRLRHQLKNGEKPAPKVSSEVLKYLETQPEYTEIKEFLPKSLLRKFKAPESMYLINRKTAKDIANTIRAHFDPHSPVIEVNPGFGFLSSELLQLQLDHIYMYEVSNSFTHYMSKLQEEHPNKITYKVADFFGLWKLAFQDKMDQGSRIKDLLGNVSTEDNDRVVKVVGAMPGLSFVKHLINTIIFHNTNNQLGRPDLYITMTAQHYEFFTNSEVQTSKHKSLPALFQLLFEYKVLSKIPKVHYLPWTHPLQGKKGNIIDDNCLYLVNITQKKQLPCPSDYLPLLWYFFKPHVIPKKTRVIPMLEQWIPGCGVWLITGQDPPDSDPLLAPTSDDPALPHMTIFTQFGDLNLRQKVTIFKRFISWPEFKQCPFRVTMENNLPKYITELEDKDDNIGTHIDDEMDASDVEHEA